MLISMKMLNFINVNLNALNVYCMTFMAGAAFNFKELMLRCSPFY